MLPNFQDNFFDSYSFSENFSAYYAAFSHNSDDCGSLFIT
ncbi:hypothetical protein MPB2EB_0190 [Mycoavidus sp. B2-EB]|nr:hypothetical protein MPB2EB_0190 [Mycoavidus sp. B2-EB]